MKRLILLKFLALGGLIVLVHPSLAPASLIFLDDGININTYTQPSGSSMVFTNKNVGNGVLSMLFTLNDVLLTAPAGGNDIYGYSGAGGSPSVFAAVANPYGLAMDASGNVYVGANGGTSIEEFTNNTENGTTSIVAGNETTLGGSANVQVESLAINPNGVLYEADDYSNNVINIVTSGGVTPFVTLGNGGNYSMALDYAGDLFVTFQTGFGSGGVYKITASGAISSFFTTSTVLPTGLAFDSETGELYMSYENSSGSGGGIDYFSSLALATQSATPSLFATDSTPGSQPFAIAVLVPEPGSIMLFAGGLLAISLFRYRRARREMKPIAVV